MTSAPRSPRSIVAYGPARTVEQSTTRIPFNGPAPLPASSAAMGRWYGVARAAGRSSRGRQARRRTIADAPGRTRCDDAAMTDDTNPTADAAISPTEPEAPHRLTLMTVHAHPDDETI